MTRTSEGYQDTRQRRLRLVQASNGDREHAERVAAEVERAERAAAERAYRRRVPVDVLQPARSRSIGLDVVAIGLALGLVAWGLIVALAFLVYLVALR